MDLPETIEGPSKMAGDSLAYPKADPAQKQIQYQASQSSAQDQVKESAQQGRNQEA